MLWNAYYALAPFGPTEKIAIETNAAIDSLRFKKEIPPAYPYEVRLNQPIEDINPLSPGSKQKLVTQLNGFLSLSGIKIKKVYANG